MFTLALVEDQLEALFGLLVFGEDSRPHDHCASLACHLFLLAGPSLERSPLGRQLADCMCGRLRELKGINFSEPTLFSLAHVTDLRLHKWVPQKEAQKPKKDKKPKHTSAPSAAESTDDKVLRIGRLFAEQRVATKVVKELFRQLLFTDRARPELARRLLTTVGPVLDQSDAGAKLGEYVQLRLRELGSDARARGRCHVRQATGEKENLDVNRLLCAC